MQQKNGTVRRAREDMPSVSTASADAIVARALQILELESRPWIESLRRPSPAIARDAAEPRIEP